MKFNLYHTTTVKGEEQQNTRLEIEYSLEELVQGHKHVIELLQHRQDISGLVKDIADTVIETVNNAINIKMQTGLAQAQAAMQMQAAQMQSVNVEPKQDTPMQNTDTLKASNNDKDLKRMVSAW